MASEAWRFIRLPYYAAVFWPLAQMPYPAAYWTWQLLSLAALVGFVLLWRPPAPPVTGLFACLSLPLATCWMNGQDATFLLLWIALAARIHKGGQPFWAGAILALGAAKPHLFVLLAVLIVAQRLWKLGAGLAAGGGMLLAVSFGVGGADWPRQYYAVLKDPLIHPLTASMPNLHGALSFFPSWRWMEWPLAAAVAWMVWRVARRGSFHAGLAATLAGGLLVGFHAYLPDGSLLLPAGLVAVQRNHRLVVRFPALLLLLPPPYVLVALQSPWSAVVPGLVLAMLLGMALEASSSDAAPPGYNAPCSTG